MKAKNATTGSTPSGLSPDGEIEMALGDIESEQDPALKLLKLASLCTGIARERGIALVTVGGSAIELLTEGAYVSGDLDFCTSGPGILTLRERQEMMALLKATGGPRSWAVAGMFVDLLGAVESMARTSMRRIQGPYGEVNVIQPEELLVERILVSVYPGPYPPARDCARKMAAVSLGGGLDLDWAEVRRLAELPAYRIFPECQRLVREVAYELKQQSPLDSN